MLTAGWGRVWSDGWVPPAGDGRGLVYGGARVGVGSSGCGCGASGAGVACSGRRAVMLLRCLGRRVRRVWMTMAASAASVWAAVDDVIVNDAAAFPSGQQPGAEGSGLLAAPPSVQQPADGDRIRVACSPYDRIRTSADGRSGLR